MKTEVRKITICPKCGKKYYGSPAPSRVDNETYIFPDCGTREALESIGVDKNEQKEILNCQKRIY